MDIPPAGGRGGRSGTAGGGYLRLLLPGHGRTVHCDQDHYGPVHGSRAETGVKDIQEVVVAGRIGCGRDADGGSGGETDRGGGGEIRDGDGLNSWGG